MTQLEMYKEKTLFCDVCNKEQSINWVAYGDTNKGYKYCNYCDRVRDVTLKTTKEWLSVESLKELIKHIMVYEKAERPIYVSERLLHELEKQKQC